VIYQVWWERGERDEERRRGRGRKEERKRGEEERERGREGEMKRGREEEREVPDIVIMKQNTILDDRKGEGITYEKSSVLVSGSVANYPWCSRD
jgi:hypothetical protein